MEAYKIIKISTILESSTKLSNFGQFYKILENFAQTHQFGSLVSFGPQVQKLTDELKYIQIRPNGTRRAHTWTKTCTDQSLLSRSVTLSYDI